MRPFEPRKIISVQHISKLFSCGVQMSGNMRIIFMGWSSLKQSRTCMYIKPQKMFHDCLRGYVSVDDLTRLGTRIQILGNGAIRIIVLNLHRSDIKILISKSMFEVTNGRSRKAKWKLKTSKRAISNGEMQVQKRKVTTDPNYSIQTTEFKTPAGS